MYVFTTDQKFIIYSKWHVHCMTSNYWNVVLSNSAWFVRRGHFIRKYVVSCLSIYIYVCPLTSQLEMRFVIGNVDLLTMSFRYFPIVQFLLLRKREWFHMWLNVYENINWLVATKYSNVRWNVSGLSFFIIKEVSKTYF